MIWIWTICKWLCGGVVGLMAFGALVTIGFAIADRIREVRQRKLYRRHQVFSFSDDGKEKILDAELERRLNAIGKFSTEVWGGGREIVWEEPAQCKCDFAPLKLIFRIDPDNIGPDEQTFQLWEQYKSQHLSHLATFKKRVIELGQNADPGSTSEKALSSILHISIAITQDGYGASASHELQASFRPEWDDEHGYILRFDPQQNAFGDWEDS